MEQLLFAWYFLQYLVIKGCIKMFTKKEAQEIYEKINNKKHILNNTIGQIDLTDIYRTTQS